MKKPTPHSRLFKRLAVITVIAVFAAAVGLALKYPVFAPKPRQGGAEVAGAGPQVLGDQSAGKSVVKEVIEVQDVPFETRTVEDPTLAQGTDVIRSEGVPGQARVRYKVIYEGGKIVSKQPVASTPTKAPVTKVIAHGTKPAPSPRGNAGRPAQPGPAPQGTPEPAPQPAPGQPDGVGGEPAPGPGHMPQACSNHVNGCVNEAKYPPTDPNEKPSTQSDTSSGDVHALGTLASSVQD